MEEKIIDFDYLRKNNLLLYEYIRGSKLYGLGRKDSDEDHGGIYIEPMESLMGIIPFPETVHDETNDDSWFSLSKFASLLLKSNPNILEALFVPEDKVIYKHPVMDLLLEHREKFITKSCFDSFIGYSKAQIEKARSLKKKITQPMDGPLQSCLSFIMYVDDMHVNNNGGSKPVIDWLNQRGLLQRYCGLVNVDKMPTIYCMYYDWGEHLYNELGISTWSEFREWFLGKELNDDGVSDDPFYNSIIKAGCSYGFQMLNYYSKGELGFFEVNGEGWKKFWEKYNKPFGFRGLVNMDNTSNEVRFSSSSSVPKGEKYLLVVSYNGDGYSTYCRQWKEYNDFKKHHNKERFNLAKEKQFDRKNATHSARLLTMGIEIAQGKGVLLDRTGIDRDFLMNIRLGNSSYDEIMSWMLSKKSEMEEAMKNSTIPEEIDPEFLNNIIIRMRNEYYKG